MTKQSFLYNNTTFSILFVITVLLIHTLPSYILQFYLIVLLVLMLFSKENAFWFALILVLSETQTFILSFAHKQTLIPTFNFLPGGLRNLYFEELFLYAFFIKALIKGKFTRLFFHKPLRLLALYFLFLIGISLVMGVSGVKFFATIRNFMGYTLLFSIPALFHKSDEYYRFFKFIFPVVFLILGIQLLELALGTQISFALNEEQAQFYDDVIIDPNKRVARQLYAQNLVVLIFIGTMYFLSLGKNSPFKRNYVFSVLATSFLSAFLSATRGYILALLVGFLIYIFFIEKQLLRHFLSYVIIGIVFLIIVANIPIVKLQLNEAFDRFMTIGLVAEGDLTAGGTLKRLTERAPPMLEKFRESPIYGWAFSNTFHQYADKHVGHVYMLLNTGIIGYGLFTYFFIFFVIRLHNRYTLSNRGNAFKQALLVFIAGFLIFYTFHSTSAAFFKYTIGFKGLALSMLMFFSFSDYIYKKAKIEKLNYVRKPVI